MTPTVPLTILAPALPGLPAGGADALLLQTYAYAQGHDWVAPIHPFLAHHPGASGIRPGTLAQRAKRLGMARAQAVGARAYTLYQGPKGDVAVAAMLPGGCVLYPEPLFLPERLDALTATAHQAVLSDLDALWAAAAAQELCWVPDKPQVWGPMATWMPGRRALTRPVPAFHDTRTLASQAMALLRATGALDVPPDSYIRCVFPQALRQIGAPTTTAATVEIWNRHRLAHLNTPLLHAEHPFCVQAARHFHALLGIDTPTSTPITAQEAQRISDITVRNHTPLVRPDTFTWSNPSPTLPTSHHARLALLAAWEQGPVGPTAPAPTP